ncbi:MAG: CoA transferase [Janthinobacterium lividum]
MAIFRKERLMVRVKGKEVETNAIAARPLDGVKVADFAVGMAAALVAKFLSEAGAEVHRMEPPGGDPFHDVHAAYSTWRSVLKSSEPFSAGHERDLILSTDICLVGGEDFPGVDRYRDSATYLAANPRLVVLDIATMLCAMDAEPLHGADILIQARSGLVFEAYPDRPALLGFVPSAYGAALNGLVALGAALCQRERDGRGQIVRVGLFEGALAWPLAFWGRAENETPRYTFKAPRGACPLIFRTRDGAYLQIVLGSSGSKFKLYKVLGIDDPAIESNDAGLPQPDDGPEKYFGDVDLLAPYVARRDSDELLSALAADGVVCESVLAPGQCWDDPQVQRNAIVGCSAAGVMHIGCPVAWTFSRGGVGGEERADRSVPLSGINVVDFGAFVAGPALSVGLGDLGADVIKVEPPRGDPLRILYSFYAAANRGKRSIALDMKRPEGLAIAHRLIRRADVVCSNFRNGVAERLGIDAAALQAAQPGKIVANNVGYGVTGPKADNPAFDPCMQAMCGLAVRAGGTGNPPSLNPMMMVDLCGALLAQIGVLMALYRHARDGSGANVVVPLLNAGLFLMSDIVQSEDRKPLGPVSLLPDQTGYHPAEKLYQTLDGWIAVAARGENAARALGEVFGVVGVSGKKRENWGETEMLALAAAIGRLSSVDVVATLRRVGVPAEVCRAAGAWNFIADDRNVRAGRVYETDRPTLGRTRGIGVLFEMARARVVARGSVSEKGEDTSAILRDVGLGQSDIDHLFMKKVVAGS